MGGEIMIIQKEYGEKGTCFRFNVSFHARETNDSNIVQEDKRFHKDQTSNDIPYKAKGLMLRNDLKLDCLHTILLLQVKEESLILQRWMECYGLKVWPINQWDQLYHTLEKIKNRMFISNSSSSSKFDSTSLQSYLGDSVSHYSNQAEKDDHSSSSIVMVRDPNKKISHNGEPNCLLIIIDMSCEYFSETFLTLACFSKNTDDLLYKVVWIANPKIPFADSQRLENRQSPCDLILQKPFHRSHLCANIQLFQENGDTIEGRSNEIKMENIISSVHSSIKLGLSKELDQIACVSTTSYTIPHTSYLTQQRVRLENDPSDDKPLSGLSILVAEDNIVLQRLAVTILSRLGATIECCNNGEDALNLIRKALQGINEMHSGNHQEMARLCRRLSYDIVLMDCEVIYTLFIEISMLYILTSGISLKKHDFITFRVCLDSIEIYKWSTNFIG